MGVSWDYGTKSKRGGVSLRAQVDEKLAADEHAEAGRGVDVVEGSVFAKSVANG